MNVFLLRINTPKITKMGQYILCESQRCDTRQSSLSPQKHNMNFLTVQRSHLPTTFITEANEEHRHSLPLHYFSRTGPEGHQDYHKAQARFWIKAQQHNKPHSQLLWKFVKAEASKPLLGGGHIPPTLSSRKWEKLMNRSWWTALEMSAAHTI